jgi:predicted membrane channel-forming protein YqfA (hemolysin III family)
MTTALSIVCGILGAIALAYGMLLDVASKDNTVWPLVVVGGVLWAVGAWLWGTRRP